MKFISTKVLGYFMISVLTATNPADNSEKAM